MINKVAKYIKQGTLANAVYNKTKITCYKRNIYNIVRYGWEAPRFGEIIWIDPTTCNMAISGRQIRELYGISSLSTSSGMVLKSLWPTDQAFIFTDCTKEKFCNEDWGKELLTIENTIKLRFKFCIDHWVNGRHWKDTGVFEFMEKRIRQTGRADFCTNMSEVKRRYENLDLIFNQVKREGKMRTKKEVDMDKFKPGEEGTVHIGPDGKTFYGGGSIHRFAIAYILEMQYPARIGLVHVSAIPYLKEYRKV